MVSCDIIKLLNDKLMTDVIRSIFSQLDGESLRQAELVSRLWWEIISEECVWKFVLKNKVLSTPLWGKFVRHKDIEWQIGPSGQDGHLYYKNIYKTIKKQLFELERNWNTGNCTFQNIDCGPGGADLCFKLGEKYIATGLLDHTVKLWNRKTFNCDKVFRGHRDHVACLQFDSNLLISGSYDKTIRVWDFETTELLNTVRDSLGAVHNLKHKNGYLISLSSDMEIVETIFCLTVRHMSSPQNITVGTCVSLNRFCNGMDFNEKYIVVPMMQPLNSDDDDCDIQLYSLSTLELVRTLKGCTQVITGFQLLGNFVITGSHDQMIRFWDMETGECKRAIKDDEMISCLGFNVKYLVTGNYDGRLKIWDFQAASDLKIPESHPFLLRTLENTEEGAMSIALDDFQIVGTSSFDGSSQVVVWDFVPVSK